MKEVCASTTAAPMESTLVLIPETVLQNRYRIVRRLGKGGMGAVYEVIDQRLDTVVALKEAFSPDERLRRQFEREARLLAQLNHPALPRVSDYFTEGNQAFLVMQFISGMDLAEIIVTQPGPFPRQTVIAWADQLLDVLIYLHSRKRQIIHRDIKPHNLKLTSSGQIVLLDFGLAKSETTELSVSHSIFGYTRRYSPLEQIQNQGTTPQSDIYALGATLYHLLTGIKPCDALGRAAALADGKADPLRAANEVHAAVGPELASVLKRAMSLRPEDRFKSANEFREALRRVGREPSVFASVRTAPQAIRSADEIDFDMSSATKARATGADPFDSYSILKPQEQSVLLSKPSRFPQGIAALLAAAILIYFAFSVDIGRWANVAGSALENVLITPHNGESHDVEAQRKKPEEARSGMTVSAVARSTSPGAAHEKRKRPSSKKPKAPPPPSLRSALSLPINQ